MVESRHERDEVPDKPPPVVVTADQHTLLARLLELDERLRHSGPHIGHAVGDGLLGALHELLRRQGIDA